MTAAEDWKGQIKAIMALPGNGQCADCGAAGPDWGVPNIGVIVCINCSGLHREMGVHIAKVRSCILDSWSQEQLDELRSKGNSVMNEKYQALMPKCTVPISECKFKEYRKWFIFEKYVHRRWYYDSGTTASAEEDEKKEERKHDDAESPGMEMAPGRLEIGVFQPATGKKRVILQLLGEFLHYFRAKEDSFSFERYNVKNLRASIAGDDSASRSSKPTLVIASEKSEHFRLLSTSNNLIELVRFAEAIKKAHLFYNSDYARATRASMARTSPQSTITADQLATGAVLGIASKKGGGVHGYKKRWWVLYAGYLYYFKKDFRTDKKSPTAGKPQGHICLFGADVAWEQDKKRSGKANALLIATPERTFFIVPSADNKESFFRAVEDECLDLWKRVRVDFTKL